MTGTMSTAMSSIFFINTAFEEPRSGHKGRLNKLVAEFLSEIEVSRKNTSFLWRATMSDKIETLERNVLCANRARAFWDKLEREDWSDLALKVLYEVYQECSEANWNGYDAIPMSQEAYFEARELLRMIPSSYPMPDILPEPNGEIGLEWYKDKDFVFAITVGGKNRITYAGLFGKDNETHGTEFFADSLPKVISENIERIFPSVE